MTLEIFYRLKPINVLSLEVIECHTKIEDYDVKINGELCPKQMKEIILAGMQAIAGLSDKSIVQVIDVYCKELGL